MWILMHTNCQKSERVRAVDHFRWGAPDMHWPLNDIMMMADFLVSNRFQAINNHHADSITAIVSCETNFTQHTYRVTIFGWGGDGDDSLFYRYRQIRLQVALQWRHNERDGDSNQQPHDCLLNRLFRRRSKKISKLCVTGLCEGTSPHKGLATRIMFPFDDIITRITYCTGNYLMSRVNGIVPNKTA